MIIVFSHLGDQTIAVHAVVVNKLRQGWKSRLSRHKILGHYDYRDDDNDGGISHERPPARAGSGSGTLGPQTWHCIMIPDHGDGDDDCHDGHDHDQDDSDDDIHLREMDRWPGLLSDSLIMSRYSLPLISIYELILFNHLPFIENTVDFLFLT